MATKITKTGDKPKDKWGRSYGSKWYNFDPKTKSYKDPENKFKPGSYKLEEFVVGKPNAASTRATDSMQVQNAAYGRPKNAGVAKVSNAAYKKEFKNEIKKSEDLGRSLGLWKKTGGATKAIMKTGGMVNANAKITAAKRATGKVGGITKAISKAIVKSAAPKGRVGGTNKSIPRPSKG